MWCAVNRVTSSGRVAGPDQRVTVEQALRGVTIEAAYSLKLEDEIGTISPGKSANLTILSENPLSADPAKLTDISVWGTVMEGRVLPAGGGKRKASLERPTGLAEQQKSAFAMAALHHALSVAHSHE
jgi:cytosine/adenosine deaminase-related metal-dependent hydrolase